jgi:Flp pilus assembly protein TadG
MPKKVRERKGIRRAAGVSCDETGQGLVELAVVLPLVLLVLLGIMDFGKAFNYWITENQVAAQGARRAAVNLGSATLQQDVLSQIAISELHDNASVCVSFPTGPTGTTAKVGDPVKVTVAVKYLWMPLLKQFGGVGTLTLRNTATMRLEANSTINTPTNTDVKPSGC